MRWSRLRAYLRRVAGRGSADRDLREELDAYLAHDIDARIRAGASAAEARRSAIVDMGGIESVTERTRAVRAGMVIDALAQDVRYATRSLRHAPGFSLSVVGSLALGIAAVIAASALIDATTIRRIPGVADSASLVQLTPYRRCDARRSDCLNLMASGAGPYNVMLNAGTDIVSGWIADTRGTVTALLPQSRTLRTQFVSGEYFDVLGVHAEVGRTLMTTDADPANAAVCVVAHNLWTRELQADPGVIGRSIQIAGELVTIVGVAPAGFAGLDGGSGRSAQDVWLPMALADRVANSLPPSTSSPPVGERYVRYLGRMKPGISLHQVRAVADVLAPRLQAVARDPSLPVWIDAAPLSQSNVARTALIVALLLPVPVLVLAVGCVNAGNLLLARASLRGREIAVRLAIGASRARVMRQLLIESLLLSLAATVAASPIVWGALRSASSYLDLPVAVDLGLAAIGVLTATISAAAFGLLPAFRATAPGAAGVLAVARTTDGTPRQARVRRWLVVAQIALSLGLLTVSVQLVHAMASEAGSAGTDPDRLILASFDLGRPGMSADSARAFYARLLDRAARLPQIQAAGLAPLRILWTFGRGHQADNSIAVWGPDDPPREGRWYFGGYTGGRFLEAVDLPVLEGRRFTTDDEHVLRPRVAVVNLPFARTVFQGNAIGRIVRVASVGAGFNASTEVQIVGVVQPALDPGFTRDGEPLPALYLPVPLDDARRLTLFVRASVPLDAVGPALRAMVREIDPQVPITQLDTLAGLNEEATGKQAWLARTGAALGVGALLLATLGLYALGSYVVAARSREFAIRIALGADPRAVLTMVARQSMTLALTGGAIGGIAALAIGRVIRSEVHSAPAVDLAALGLSMALLVGAMMTASIIPAARAARVNPVGLLKED